MLSGKGLRPLQVVSVILVVRLLSVFAVQTWYVPDEYWQTLEVAHKQAFGYGALTWEWQRGIRSYLYPSIVAALYTVLKYTGLDYPDAVIILPRILQALLSTAADYSFYKWTGGRKWALFLILTSWFWFYTSGRTLLQTAETSLVTIALSLFPFKSGRLGYYEKESNHWLWLACIAVFVRPTSAALWAVLGAYNLFTTNQGRLRLLVRTYVPIALVTGGALVALDSYFHGSLIVTPWEFFRFNILHDIASFYGQHPWHWYLTQGLPAVFGVHLVLALWGAAAVLRRPKENRAAVLLLAAAAVHIALYSFIPHKEFRFVLPLLPIFLYVAQDVVVPWSRKAKKWQLYTLAGLILIGNAVPALYFGVIHQSGTLKVMPLLREALPNNRSSVVFLMPCHSTPLYSHLHMNVTTRYLNCDPPINKIGETHESEAFFNNPQRWWRAEYSTKQTPNLVVMFDVLRGRIEAVLQGYRKLYELPHTQYSNKQTPNLVVMFDVLRGRIEAVLQGYRKLYELPHTQFPEGEVGANILVYQKSDSPRRTDEAI